MQDWERNTISDSTGVSVLWARNDDFEKVWRIGNSDYRLAVQDCPWVIKARRIGIRLV